MIGNKNISACGIDFGTSNSTIGICANNNPKLIPLVNGGPKARKYGAGFLHSNPHASLAV